MSESVLERGPSVEPSAFTGRPSGRWSRLPVRFPRRRAISVLSVLVGALGWEIVSDFVVHDPLFLTGPSAVFRRFLEMVAHESLLYQMQVSGIEFGIGMLVSIGIGVPLGLALALLPNLRAALRPWISGLYSTPTVALAPLFILWFGLGLQGKVVVVVLVAVFPIVINTEVGVMQADHDQIEMARVLGWSGHQLFLRVHLRSALPFVLTGIRLAIGKAIIGVVVAELFGARAGLGYQITISSQAYDTAGLFAAVGILAVAGVGLSAMVQLLENALAPWRRR
ncbi:ABC transporter permease [Actinacidiphila oryziradicis]|jgi:NitT/TauT family transport system permease protein|uniref:ABC transporter permease n=1 Tax=Actinacidiphila oryziradicis TaxID=2571141 RepID=UPI0023F07F26|nr:ABC transporter permease [Actinacidiphila oryziradicis]MCW2874853.1 ssuC 3 [Actinacidiphila oryziradicis]